MSYCDPEELKVLVQQAQASGVVSERLAVFVVRIAAGIQSRYYRWLDRDDFCSDVLLNFFNVYRTCDTTRPASELFNWLSVLAKNHGWQQQRALSNYRRKLMRFARHLGERVPTP